MRNSRDHVSCAQHLEVTYAMKKKSQLFIVSSEVDVEQEKKFAASIFYFIIWLCLTRTGNYQIHEFDWLKRILTAVWIFPSRPASRPGMF